MKRSAWPLVLLLAASPAVAQEELAEIGKQAPVFRLPMYNPASNGPTVLGLDRYVGAEPAEKGVKVLLLSFMASFCEPCKKEMPYLESLQQMYRDFGLRVVAISIDAESEGQQKIEALISANKITFPVLKDRFQLVGRRWLGSSTPLPSLFVVNPDGTIKAIHRGYTEDGKTLLANEVESALGIKRAKPAAPAPVAAVPGPKRSSARKGSAAK